MGGLLLENLQGIKMNLLVLLFLVSPFSYADVRFAAPHDSVLKAIYPDRDAKGIMRSGSGKVTVVAWIFSLPLHFP